MCSFSPAHRDTPLPKPSSQLQPPSDKQRSTSLTSLPQTSPENKSKQQKLKAKKVGHSLYNSEPRRAIVYNNSEFRYMCYLSIATPPSAA